MGTTLYPVIKLNSKSYGYYEHFIPRQHLEMHGNIRKMRTTRGEEKYAN